MGNSNSNENQQYNKQSGAGYTNNTAELQRNIEKMVRTSRTYAATDTIGFVRQSESDIDFDSVMDLQQNGGGLDFLNVKPNRHRFINQPINSVQNLQQSGSTIKGLQTDITQNDLAMLKSIPVAQKGGHHYHTGGCGCNAGNDPKVSDTSADPINYDVIKGGAKKNKDDDDEDDEDDDDSSESENDNSNSETVEEKDDDELSDDETEDDDSESSESDDDIEETSAYSDSATQSNNFLVQSSQEGGKKSKQSKGSSKGSSKKSKKSKTSKLSKGKTNKKKQSRNYLEEHVVNNSDSANDIVIDYKNLYSSEGDAFHKSDESTDQFGEYRNRNMFRFK